MPFTRIAVSWSRWTKVPSNLAEGDCESQREQLNAAIERARKNALDHIGESTVND
jgi:hypothetical protein